MISKMYLYANNLDYEVSPSNIDSHERERFLAVRKSGDNSTTIVDRPKYAKIDTVVVCSEGSPYTINSDIGNDPETTPISLAGFNRMLDNTIAISTQYGNDVLPNSLVADDLND